MKTVVGTVAALLIAAGAASAQDDREKKMDELRREFDRTMKGLQQKFDQERQRLEKEFKAAQEKLLEKKDGEAPRKPEKFMPGNADEMLRRLTERVERLEKRLEEAAPKFRALPQVLPHKFEDFNFKRFGEFKPFGDGLPEEWRRWLEQMPRGKGGENFRFEFKKEERREKEKDDDKGKEKGKKKGKDKEKDEDDQQY